MKNKPYVNWMLWLIPAVSLILSAAFYNSLPQQIPMQFGSDGSVNYYGDKLFVFAMPAISVVVLLFMYILPKIDPKKDNYKKFGKQYNWVVLLTLLILLVANISVIAYSMGYPIDVSLIVPIAVGFMLTVIGNMMPKFKQSYFVGIKTPWTLSDDEVWNRTHRIGGRIWFAGGLVMVAAVFLPSQLIDIVMPVLVLSLVIVPIAYSYVIYRKLHPKQD